MELVAGLSLSLFGGSGQDYTYRKPQPPIVINILPPPSNSRTGRGMKKKEKKKKKKKKKPYNAHPRLTNTNDYDSLYRQPRHGPQQQRYYSEDQAQVYSTATTMGARGNNTSTYYRQQNYQYERKEEIDEEESDGEESDESDEEESDSDDESDDESHDEEEDDDSDGEETVHYLPAGREGRPQQHQRNSRRVYY